MPRSTKPRRRHRGPAPSGTVSVAFTPDGRRLAASTQNGTVRIWDVADPARPGVGRHRPDPTRPRPTAVLTGHAGTVYRLGISADGRRLATPGKDGTVRVWDVGDPAAPVAVATLTNHGDSVKSASFSPDGTVLATGSADATVRLWHLDAGEATTRVRARVRTPIDPAEWQRRFPGLPHDPPCGH